MAATLAQLAAELPQSTIAGDAHATVTGIAYDSRRVAPGDLFVCIRGFAQDGHVYAEEAAAKGAAALLVSRSLPTRLPQVIVPETRDAMGPVAAKFWGYPSRRLRVVGVTGTNGKTTTAYFIRSALSAGGERCGLIGTVEQSTGGPPRPASRTTPESVDIQRLLREMVDHGCASCVMEVSSHGLALRRTAGVEFDMAVFTNLTRDHFDFHKSAEAYLEAKLTLFRSLSPQKAGATYAIINGDDPYAHAFAEAAAAPVITYGIEGDYDVVASGLSVSRQGSSYRVETSAGSAQVNIRLPGRFNVYNSLAAISVGVMAGIELDAVVAALPETVVPGRFEPVDAGQDFSVIVDYAHTPDSLENVLLTAKALCEGRLIVVFGAGGDRDPGKRPLMGRVAARHADVVIVTSDNPRFEEPMKICADVAAGVREEGRTRFDVIVDRREAIEAAIAMAQPGDFVLIAGKGHETYQEICGVKHHFDDRETARHAIREGIGHGQH